MLDLFIQKDLRWQNDSMALPTDCLGDLGCLVTCFANMTIATQKNPVTPGLFVYSADTLHRFRFILYSNLLLKYLSIIKYYV